MQHDSTTEKNHSTQKRDEWYSRRSILLGSSNLELRKILFDFNTGNISQIQDRSQQYQRRLSGLLNKE